MGRKYRVLTHLEIVVDDDELIVSADLTGLGGKLEHDLRNDYPSEVVAEDAERVQSVLDDNFFNQFFSHTIRRDS